MKMMKKVYNTPQVVVTELRFTTTLLAGSPFIINQDAGSSDGEYYDDNLSQFLEADEDFSEPNLAPEFFEV